MMGGYSAQDLHELAEHDLSRAAVGGAGDFTGVALPDWVQAGAILTPARARRLAAQLLSAADLHDAIADAAIAELRR